MADNKKQPATSEEEKNTAPEEGQKKNNLIIIIVGGFLALLLLLGGLVAFILSGGSEEQPEQQPVAQATEHVSDGTEVQASRLKTSLKVGPMFPLNKFIVNLLSENGRRYLKVEVNLELESGSEELSNELTTKVPVIRDIVIRIASSKNLEEISTEKGKDKLKDQIVTEINQNLKDGKVVNIFFTDFVIQ